MYNNFHLCNIHRGKNDVESEEIASYVFFFCKWTRRGGITTNSVFFFFFFFFFILCLLCFFYFQNQKIPNGVKLKTHYVKKKIKKKQENFSGLFLVGLKFW